MMNNHKAYKIKQDSKKNMKYSEIRKILKEVEVGAKTQLVEYPDGTKNLPLIIGDQPKRQIISYPYKATYFDPRMEDLLVNAKDVISCEQRKSAGSKVYVKRLWVEMPKLLDSAEQDLKSGLLESILKEKAYIAVGIGEETHIAEAKDWGEFFNFLKEENSGKTLYKFHLNVNINSGKGFFFHAEKGKSATLSWNDYQMLRKMGNHLFPFEESKYIN